MLCQQPAPPSHAPSAGQQPSRVQGCSTLSAPVLQLPRPVRRRASGGQGGLVGTEGRWSPLGTEGRRSPVGTRVTEPVGTGRATGAPWGRRADSQAWVPVSAAGTLPSLGIAFLILASLGRRALPGLSCTSPALAEGRRCEPSRVPCSAALPHLSPPPSAPRPPQSCVAWGLDPPPWTASHVHPRAPRPPLEMLCCVSGEPQRWPFCRALAPACWPGFACWSHLMARPQAGSGALRIHGGR